MGIEIRLESHIQEAMEKMQDVAKDRMTEAVNEVRNVTLDTLSGPRHGRTYKIPGTSRTYTASSPGEPPAQRLGELRQSVTAVVEGEGRQLVGKVGTNKDYGPMQEFGTKNIAPRPWLRVSFEKAERTVKDIFSREWFK